MLSNEIPWDKGSPRLFYPTISQHISISREGSFLPLSLPRSAWEAKSLAAAEKGGKMLK